MLYHHFNCDLEINGRKTAALVEIIERCGLLSIDEDGQLHSIKIYKSGNALYQQDPCGGFPPTVCPFKDVRGYKLYRLPDLKINEMYLRHMRSIYSHNHGDDKISRIPEGCKSISEMISGISNDTVTILYSKDLIVSIEQHNQGTFTLLLHIITGKYSTHHDLHAPSTKDRFDDYVKHLKVIRDSPRRDMMILCADDITTIAEFMIDTMYNFPRPMDIGLDKLPQTDPYVVHYTQAMELNNELQHWISNSKTFINLSDLPLICNED